MTHDEMRRIERVADHLLNFAYYYEHHYNDITTSDLQGVASSYARTILEEVGQQ